MVVLFVHGMGRSPLSGWLLLHRLRQSGLATQTFGYIAALEDFDAIVDRLRMRIEALASIDSYVVVGQSLGGVLLRAALNALPHNTALPSQVYLLGSPIQPSRLAMKFRDNILYRFLCGDCGQLLGSAERMNAIGPVKSPTTAIMGVSRLASTIGPFNQELNDGVVSVSEVSAEWLSAAIQVPGIHASLPSSSVVASIIIRGLPPKVG
ncbi:MAG: alpha/beta hydrolase [Cyanobacteria bacterium J06626_18]